MELENPRATQIVPLNMRKNEMADRMASLMAAWLVNFPSKGTSTEYGRTAGEFFSFISSFIREISDLKRDHIIFYKKSLTDRGLSHKTILKKLSAISSLCKFLAHEGVIEKDLTYGVKRPKTYNKKETAAFTEEEVRRIFSSLNPRNPSYHSSRA
ncbi:MAG: site-specific integrase, partial [Oligoflexales bacterium]|nr:site-specific integrase [Oligoflexales bacterium]